MPDVTAYLKASAPSETVRAVMAWLRISEVPTEITIDRVGTAQTVRIEHHTVQTVSGAEGTGAVARVTVFGVRGHPTVPDTDIQRGDRFAVADDLYEVVLTVALPGEVQAFAERIA